MKTDSIISPPLNTSSAVICAAFFCPISSPNARSPLVSAARSPASCVPPAGVGMVLQYQLYEPSDQRSEEHTSELQSLMRTSYAVFCLKKKKHIRNATQKLQIVRTHRHDKKNITPQCI